MVGLYPLSLIFCFPIIVLGFTIVKNQASSIALPKLTTKPQNIPVKTLFLICLYGSFVIAYSIIEANTIYLDATTLVCLVCNLILWGVFWKYKQKGEMPSISITPVLKSFHLGETYKLTCALEGNSDYFSNIEIWLHGVQPSSQENAFGKSEQITCYRKQLVAIPKPQAINPVLVAFPENDIYAIVESENKLSWMFHIIATSQNDKTSSWDLQVPLHRSQ